MAIYEGYFDESGAFDDPSKIFCISGYFLDSECAKWMTQEWNDVLAEFSLPFFHMVDCAHGTPPFDKLTKDQRIEVEKRLIGLIKKYTISGFSAVAHADYFKATPDHPDVYSACADMCSGALFGLLELRREIKDSHVAYFFESGHDSEGLTYKLLAEKLKGSNASVSFARKREVPLLQAADLLAWQTAKYVKDNTSKARPPRADFLSLMEHEHDFLFMNHYDDVKQMSWESWPPNRRSAKTSSLTLHTKQSIPYFTENDEPIPIFPAQQTIGWRLGGGRMVFVRYKNLIDKTHDFAVSFDERALQESVLMQILGLESYLGSDNLTRFIEVAKRALEKIEDANKRLRGEG